jgi:hypothetical protein
MKFFPSNRLGNSYIAEKCHSADNDITTICPRMLRRAPWRWTANHNFHYMGTPEGDVRRGWLDHSMHEEVPGCLSTTPCVTWIWTMRRTDYILAAKTKGIASQLAICPVHPSTFLATMIQQKEKQRSGHHYQEMIINYISMQLQPLCRRRAATCSQPARDGWLLCLTKTRHCRVFAKTEWSGVQATYEDRI